MRLRLQELQKVVKRAIDEEKATEVLRTEVARVLGPSVVTEGRVVEQVAEAANERIAVLDRTGRGNRIDFKPSTVVPFLNHKNPEVRKFAARVLPEKFVAQLRNDHSAAVRAVVAARLPLPQVREMMRRFPQDDQLRTVFRKRRLAEAGIKKPEEQPLGHDPVEDAERLGDAVKQADGPELSEQWYKDKAACFMQDYGGNIEYAWEELAVKQYVMSARQTSLVEIDEAKLLKAIKEAIKEREDRAMERDALRETLSWLKAEEEKELLVEQTLPVLDETVDEVSDLLASNATSSEYIDRANKIFTVRESTLPAAIKKHRLGEENNRLEQVPMVGRLPHARGFRAIDERALDLYCKYWNDRQMLRGEPLKLEWSCHPDEVGKVSFSTILR
jgi:hypothetical protein